jgi:hypothetical protein
MIFRRFPLTFVFAACCTIGLNSCGKSNERGTALIYNTWAFTSSYGRITVNGNPLGASESSNSNGDITVSFQSGGNYHFALATVSSETDGFSLIDSTILLKNDSSQLANYCAYPVVYFLTTPGPPKIILQAVSPRLQIQFISMDSLLVKTDLIKPGNNAPDTLYTEYTGFRKK